MTSKSGDLSRLALGTVQFGLDYGIGNTSGKTSVQEVQKLLTAAKDAGVLTLDTAAGYGDSEAMIGNNNSEGFDIISKFPASVSTAAELKNSLDQSLNNLKRKSLYGYLAHDTGNILKYPFLWQSMLDLKESSVIKKIGCSLYLPDQLEQLLSLNYTPGIVQVPYNFIDRRFEKYFDQLKSLGCEIHVRSAFLQGLFFMDTEKLAAFFNPVKSLLIKLKQQFKTNNELAGFLMSFVLSNKNIDKLVFGVNTATQFYENINSLQLHKTPSVFSWQENVPDNILMPNKWPQ